MDADLKGVVIVAVCAVFILGGFVGCTVAKNKVDSESQVLTSRMKYAVVKACIENGNNPSECASITRGTP